MKPYKSRFSEEDLRKMDEMVPPGGPKEPGEQFWWGPGDVEVTYSPDGKYPPGQYVPTPEEQRQMDQEAQRGGSPSRLYAKFKMRKK